MNYVTVTSNPGLIDEVESYFRAHHMTISRLTQGDGESRSITAKVEEDMSYGGIVESLEDLGVHEVTFSMNCPISDD